jgi:hypothetical protein
VANPGSGRGVAAPVASSSDDEAGDDEQAEPAPGGADRDARGPIFETHAVRARADLDTAEESG